MQGVQKVPRETGAAAARRLTQVPYVGAAASVMVLLVVSAMVQPNFFSIANFVNIAETNAALAIVCVGMTFVVLIGGVDLSVGGVAALSGVLFGKMLGAGVPALGSVLAVMSAAVVVGIVTNGYVIAYLKLNFFVVTLGTASLFSGLALGLSGGSTIPLYDVGFVSTLGQGHVLGISISLWCVLAIAVGAAIILYCTALGRMIYAVGGNAQAAHLSGINVRRVRLFSYSLCFILAAIAGLVTVGRLQAADPGAGAELALLAAAATLLGGNSFYGGEGGVGRTFLGVIFLASLANLLTLSGVAGFWQGVITGTVLVLAVGFDRIRQQRESV